MKNRSIIFSFLSLSIFSVNAMELARNSDLKQIRTVRTFSTDLDINVFHDGQNFFVKEKQDLKIKPINRYDVDSLLQKMNRDQLETFQKTAGYLVAKRLSNGEYKLNAHVNGDGGGIGGATVGFWSGKFLVHAVAQGTYAVIAGGVGLVCPPAAPVVYGALQLTFAVPVEVASNVVAIGSAVALGTATGPV